MADLRVISQSLAQPRHTPETGNLARELVKEIAMDIGKAVAAHIEVMYPAAVKATSSTFLLSVRNCVHNEIMAALETTDAEAIRERLKERKRWRAQWRKTWRNIRKSSTPQ